MFKNKCPKYIPLRSGNCAKEVEQNIKCDEECFIEETKNTVEKLKKLLIKKINTPD